LFLYHFAAQSTVNHLPGPEDRRDNRAAMWHTGSTQRVRPGLTVARRAMACEFSVVLPGCVRGGVDLACTALDEIERLENVLSVFRGGSEVSRLNRQAAASHVAASPDLLPLLRLSLTLSRATGGAFDAASGALVRAWGFLDGPRRVPPDPEREAALASRGSRSVALDPATGTVRFLHPNAEFNFGAIGKGYAIDRAAAVLRRLRHGVSALLHGGQSSLLAMGAPAGSPRGWPVDLGDPYGGSRPLGRFWLRERAMGTSSASKQYFVSGGRRYGHILDPRTGWPAARVISATVLAPTAAEADALSTAFFVMGAEAAGEFCNRHPHLGAVIVRKTRNAGPPETICFGAAGMEALR
jgi:thiamine biosynthesis lipoprotein